MLAAYSLADSIEVGDAGHEDRVSILDEPSRARLWEHYAGTLTAPSSAATPHGTCESAMNAAASALTSAANDAWNFVRSRNRKPS